MMNKIGERNEDGVSTPEQDPKILESITRACLIGPKGKKTCGPIVKSKIHATDFRENEDYQEYAVVKGSSGNVMSKQQQFSSITTAVKKKSAVTSGVFSKSTQAQSEKVKVTTTNGSKLLLLRNETKNPILSKLNSKVQAHTQPTAVIPNVSPKRVTVSKMKRNILPPQQPAKKSEKEKYYDSMQVKSFMEQQREVRRLRERKIQAERKLEAVRKKQLLVELENKRRDLISKNKVSPKADPKTPEAHLSLATKIYRARKAKSPPAHANKIPSNTAHSHVRYPSKKLSQTEDEIEEDVENEGMTDLRAEAEAELRTSLLLQEFENIVHRECLKLSSQSRTKITTRTTAIALNEKVDKSIETTNSLYEDAPQMVKSRREVSHQKFINMVPIDKIREAAAIKIQAAYRGYRIQKIWREVNEQRNNRRPARRISFYRASSETGIKGRRLLPLTVMSPAHSSLSSTSAIIKSSSVVGLKDKSAFGMSVDYAPYIPPPSPNPLYGSPTLRSMNNPIHFYPVSVTGSRSAKEILKSRFEEPFPKEAIKQFALQSPGSCGMSSPVPSDHFLERNSSATKMNVTTVNMVHIPGISELFQPNLPTFSTVLREKVRYLQERHGAEGSKALGTPVKTSSMDYYESDSTQHASILMSSKTKQVSSSTDVTITDDYIGPDEQAMQLAYNLRKSPRLSLEPQNDLERDAHGPKRKKLIHNYVDVDIDNENESTIESVNTSTTSISKPSNEMTMEVDEDSISIRCGHGGLREDLNLNQPKDSLTDFRRKINETKEKLLEHAHATSIEELQKQQVLAGGGTNQNLHLEDNIRQIQQELCNVNQTVRLNFAKLLPELSPHTRLESHFHPPDYLLEFAKCQVESLKATAETHKWLLELRKVSSEELRETRHQETVNIATAVIAAVEEVKKLAQIQGQKSQNLSQLHCHGTLEIINDTQSYTSDEFLEDSSSDYRIQVEDAASLKALSYDEVVGKFLEEEPLHEVASSIPVENEGTSEGLPISEFSQLKTEAGNGVSLVKDTEPRIGTNDTHTQSPDKVTINRVTEDELTNQTLGEESLQDALSVSPIPVRHESSSEELYTSDFIQPKTESGEGIPSVGDEELRFEKDDMEKQILDETTIYAVSQDESKIQILEESLNMLPSSFPVEYETSSEESFTSEISQPKTESGEAVSQVNVAVPKIPKDEMNTQSPDEATIDVISQDESTDHTLEEKSLFNLLSSVPIGNKESSVCDASKVHGISPSPPPPVSNSPQDELRNVSFEATLDMLDLTVYQEEHGVYIPKSCPKWCCRPRDIVDQALVTEMMSENHLWTDLRTEETVVKDSLTDSVTRRIVQYTIKSVTNVLED